VIHLTSHAQFFLGIFPKDVGPTLRPHHRTAMVMQAFGQPQPISGKAGAFDSTLVPIGLLQNLKPRIPTPITLSGTSARVFTLNHGTTNRGTYWNGTDYFELDESKTFTFSTSNNVLHATTGAITAVTSFAAGIWYFYIGMDSSGNVLLYPSTAAPSMVETRWSNGILAHPGTATTQFWNYVGFVIITTAGDADTAPVLDAAVKVGYQYYLETALTTTSVATTATQKTFGSLLPAHGYAEVAGYVTNVTASAGYVELHGSTASAGLRLGTTSTDASVNTHPFMAQPVDTNGAIYVANSATVSATLTVPQIKDIV